VIIIHSCKTKRRKLEIKIEEVTSLPHVATGREQRAECEEEIRV